MPQPSAPAPVVTTVLTTYRRPKLLLRAVASVLQQTYAHVHVLVLDDASGDETEDRVKTIALRDPRVTYIQHPRNLGMTANWQYGLQHVETPYFSFLSDDDLLLPDFYSTALQVLEANREAHFFCGRTVVFSDDGRVGRVSGENWKPGLYLPPAGLIPMMTNAISWNGILFRTSIRDAIGDLQSFHSTDYDFLVRAARSCGFFVSEAAVAMFMEHSGRAWSHVDNERIFEEFFRLAPRLLANESVPLPSQVEAFQAVRDYGYVTAKYLMLWQLLQNQKAQAQAARGYLKAFSGNSFGYFKATLFCWAASSIPWVRSQLANRLTHPSFTETRHRRYDAQYGVWVDYADRLLRSVQPDTTQAAHVF